MMERKWPSMDTAFLDLVYCCSHVWKMMNFWMVAALFLPKGGLAANLVEKWNVAVLEVQNSVFLCFSAFKNSCVDSCNWSHEQLSQVFRKVVFHATRCLQTRLQLIEIYHVLLVPWCVVLVDWFSIAAERSLKWLVWWRLALWRITIPAAWASESFCLLDSFDGFSVLSFWWEMFSSAES